MKKIMFFTIVVITALMLGILSGCGDVAPVVKVDDSLATTGSVDSVVKANNQFAFDMYSELKKTESDNIFYSPYSISTALAMTYEGARGKTAEEMQAVLHIPEDANTRRPAFASIYNQINKKDKEYKLSTANALWAQKEYGFLPGYFDTINKYYGGKVTNLDFRTDPDGSAEIINTWIEDQTNDKIKDIIEPGVLNDVVRLVLTNAIYFKGTWLKQFDKKDTNDQEFSINPGNAVKAPMMSLTGDEAKFNYAETDKLQALEMMYDGKELSMLILLPKEDDLADAEEYLDVQKLSELKQTLREQQINVYFPKFTFETKYAELPNTLKRMGMVEAFDIIKADFSGMTGRPDLYVGAVIHQAFVEVNEEGTEAAAATVVVMETKASMERPKEFRADHPFIFLIQDRATGNILFIGRVIDPRTS